MYRNFFSLSELPFSISPDPKYLFMSERHKEALSHLTYGLGEVGGFALLTGEVGTGKTTISRCLMEQLPDNTQVAFILNPTLSSQELLATICDELKIRYRKTDASLKSLTDKISEKLLKNHELDMNTLLIIDEAQHLQPEVLEQLRLLTNLETNTKKLLQVILIGQPELQQLLQRRDLRQLAQRITARYHLMPLTKQELNQYIEHRLAVADCTRQVFDKGALAKIHQISQGIPRIINLLCHSALMLAYNQNDSVINKKIIIKAAERSLGDDLGNKHDKGRYNSVLLLSTAVSLTGLIVVIALTSFDRIQTQVPLKQVIVDNKIEAGINNEKDVVKLVPDSTLEATAVTDKSEPSEIRPTIAKNQEEQIVENNNSTEIEKSIVVVEPVEVTKKQDSESTESFPPVIQEKQIIVSAKEPKPILKNKENYQVTQIDGVSNDLLARFQKAIDETEPEANFDQKIDQRKPNSSRTNRLTNDNNTQDNVRSLLDMSKQFQNAVPALNFEQHIYASNGEGWVKVNGRDRYEGDAISNKLVVEKILPQQIILSFQGEKFSLPALTNW